MNADSSPTLVAHFTRVTCKRKERMTKNESVSHWRRCRLRRPLFHNSLHPPRRSCRTTSKQTRPPVTNTSLISSGVAAFAPSTDAFLERNAMHSAPSKSIRSTNAQTVCLPLSDICKRTLKRWMTKKLPRVSQLDFPSLTFLILADQGNECSTELPSEASRCHAHDDADVPLVRITPAPAAQRRSELEYPSH